MTEFIIIGILIILFGGFLYWAYLPDYRRNPKEFWRTLIGMPIGMLLGGIGFRDLNEQIRKWAVGERKENKTEK
jgi:glucose uptake protein GlcU